MHLFTACKNRNDNCFLVFLKTYFVEARCFDIILMNQRDEKQKCYMIYFDKQSSKYSFDFEKFHGSISFLIIATKLLIEQPKYMF